MTRRDAALTALQARPGQWITGAELIDAGAGYRYAARIHELKQAGHRIEERADPTKRSKLGQYRLIAEPVQMTLEDVA